jgi:hypothetical protein
MANYGSFKQGELEVRMPFHLKREHFLMALCDWMRFFKDAPKPIPFPAAKKQLFFTFLREQLKDAGMLYFSLEKHKKYSEERRRDAEAFFDELFPSKEEAS